MPGPSIDLIYGPMLIGVFFNCILFGVMIMQIFIYFQTYTKDIPWIRYFVVYLLIAEMANTACDMYLIYQPLVKDFGTLLAVTYYPLLLAASPVVTVLISTPIQMFTAWRISVISQGKKIPALVCLFSLVSFAGAMKVTVDVATFKLFSTKDTFKFNMPGVIWFVGSACADVLITVTLVYSLSVRKTGHASTNVSVNRIIRLTVQTGLVTMLFALADLLFFTISSKTAISFVWDFSISKLYTNALLSTLNARVGWNSLNSTDQDPDNVLFGDTTFRAATNPSTTFLSNPSRRNNMMVTSEASAAANQSFELEPAIYKGDSGVKVTTDIITDHTSVHPHFYPTESVTQ